MNLPWIKEPKSGEPSVTLTMFVAGMSVSILKLLVSGITIKGFAMSTFSGGDFAAVVTALGGVYVLRRNFGNPNNTSGGSSEGN